jgi:hypothetical protein
MKRLEEVQSPQGQAALQYYQLWMRLQQRTPPPASTFIDSKYFRTFCTFAQHAMKVQLPYPDRFIRLMIEKKLPPTLWASDEVYSLFLEYIDRVSTPLEQAKLSIDTLLGVATKYDVDISEVLDVVTVNEVLHLIRLRKLSPWLLLFCPSFKKMYAEKASPEQRMIIDTVIRVEYWQEKFSQHIEDTRSIRQYVVELGL